MNPDDPRDVDRPPALRPGDVHVWRVAPDRAGAILARLGPALSADERARGDRFRSAGDRAEFLASRAALRAILGIYRLRDPGSLAFRIGPHGKPSLEGDPAIEFNLSHSGGLALVAVTTGRRVGVDVERIRPVSERDAIVARFLSPRERSEFSRLPDALKDAGFFRAWTSKEAYIKALGTGLAEPLDGFTVAVDPREPARLVEVASDPAGASRWTIREFDGGPDYMAAVAAEGSDWDIRVFDLVGSAVRTIFGE